MYKNPVGWKLLEQLQKHLALCLYSTKPRHVLTVLATIKMVIISKDNLIFLWRQGVYLPPIILFYT